MTTTSTESPYTRTAVQLGYTRDGDVSRDVLVTLERDGLTVIGMRYPATPEEGLYTRPSETRTWDGTEESNEQVALDALTVEVMLEQRASQDEQGVDSVREDVAASGQAATWLEEDF